MIYCVEDDSSIRDIEIYTLNSTGLIGKGFGTGKELFDALDKEMPDLILLDVMLPDEDGVHILKRLKADARTASIPVIMATAKGTEFDKIQSLDLGADDYLVKPFGMMEMVSRIKAVLRRCVKTQTIHTLQIEDLIMNLDEHTLSIEGRRIQLTYKEFNLLRLFLSNPGMVFTRDQLFAEVWGMDHLSESRTVDTHIRTLRQKIDPYGDLIETVRNVGYRLEART